MKQTNMINLIYVAIDIDLNYSIYSSFIFKIVKEYCKSDKVVRLRVFSYA